MFNVSLFQIHGPYLSVRVQILVVYINIQICDRYHGLLI
jgi:hypothetical protein